MLFNSTNLSFVLCQSCKFEFGLWIAIWAIRLKSQCLVLWDSR